MNSSSESLRPYFDIRRTRSNGVSVSSALRTGIGSIFLGIGVSEMMTARPGLKRPILPIICSSELLSIFL